jgi:hypothetical protein
MGLTGSASTLCSNDRRLRVLELAGMEVLSAQLAIGSTLRCLPYSRSYEHI